MYALEISFKVNCQETYIIETNITISMIFENNIIKIFIF